MLVVVFVAASTVAQNVEFEQIGDYELLVGQDPERGARFYRSPQAVLVVSNQLPSPVLLSVKSGEAQAVPVMRLAPKPGGDVDLLRGDALAALGRYEVRDDGIYFNHGDIAAVLRLKPDLVGERVLSELLEYSVDYRRGADNYQPDPEILANLRKVGPEFHVRIVFGSWCHVCSAVLPRGLKVQEALGDTQIRFEYFGLPGQGAGEQPEVKRLGVSSLPTAIVYRGDREIGRYAGAEEWTQPEARLWAAIRSAQ
jgi:hypothetical protein